MNDIIEININIGISEYINAFLVHKDIRNAMLIQPADYDEAISTDSKTAKKLRALAKAFPDLIQSNVSGETIISKKSYTEADIQSNEDMGNILGFPCAADYDKTLRNPDAPKTRITINVNLRPGGNDESLQLLVYMCTNEESFPAAELLAKKAESALLADPILKKIVLSVTAHKRTIKSPKYLIQKFMHIPSQDDIQQAVNYIWNLGLEDAVTYSYNFSNPIHRGIVIGLLSIYNNNTIEPFYPLQFRPEKEAVDLITETWNNELKMIFSTKGGKRKTRRNKHK